MSKLEIAACLFVLFLCIAAVPLVYITLTTDLTLLQGVHACPSPSSSP